MVLSKQVFTTVLLVIGLLSFSAKAQQEFTLYHMPVLSQSTHLNPASVPEHKVSLTLPGLSSFVGFNNSAFSVKSLMDREGNVDYNKFVEGLKERNNYIGTGFSTDLFHLRIKAANNFFAFSTRLINDNRILYPKDLLGVVATGFEDQYQLSGIGLHSSTYLEHAIGFTRAKPDSPWTYGGRFKILQGIANVQTNRSDLEFNIDNESNYRYDVNVDMEVNTSLGVDESVITELDDLNNLSSVQDFRDAISLNNGYAIDGGVTFQHTDRISYGLAVNNVGFINWNNFTRNYTAQLETSFDGLILDDFNNLNNQGDSIADYYVDQLEQSTDTSRQAYTTWLPSTIFLSAHYQLTPKTRLSASLYSEVFRGISLGATAGLNISVGRGLDFTTSWWYLRNAGANMGLGLVFKPGWFQFHLVMDNVLPARLVRISDQELGVNDLLLPYTARNFNLRFGINFVFGRIKNESMLPNQGVRKGQNAFRKYIYKPRFN